ncbi:hypothetical protein GM31_00240 [Trabulsiella odontotermitis]|uniref:Uncharacterized protein n=1 Tax=Trabulsiella odontotermitis TaxID=379893 RepID=A0A0L0GTN6_9ENTR|nr:hypothetical protein GM31_00240 [Trabulsiella odontotermitis]
MSAAPTYIAILVTETTQKQYRYPLNDVIKTARLGMQCFIWFIGGFFIWFIVGYVYSTFIADDEEDEEYQECPYE